MALTASTRLGHYDVTALIGEGGMGQLAACSSMGGQHVITVATQNLVIETC